MYHAKQTGFVSIITVITLCTLISLITLAFVKTITTGQRQVLDSQLSTQAYYAAETGINDAMKAITTNPSAIKADDTDCAPEAFSVGGPQPNTTLATGTTTVSYTCQLVTSGTKDILITADNGVSRVFPIRTDISARSITVEWEDRSDYVTFNEASTGGGVDKFPAAASWSAKSPALMRLTVYTPGGGNISSDTLIANQKNFFIKPGDNNQSGKVDINGVDGTAAYAQCDVLASNRPYACRIIIDGLSSGGSQDTTKLNGVFIKVQPIYTSANYRIIAGTTSDYNTSAALAMFGAQYRIDVTGRANDVYRRLEVRLPLSGFTSPDGGVDSGSICKKFDWNGSSVVGGPYCSP